MSFRSFGIFLSGALAGSVIIVLTGFGSRPSPLRGQVAAGKDEKVAAGASGGKEATVTAPSAPTLSAGSVGSISVIGGGRLCESDFVARSFTGAEIARAEQDVAKWLVTVDMRLETWNNAHATKTLEGMRREWRSDPGHPQFFAVFPPEGPLCSKELSTFGPGGWTNKKYSLGERAHRRDLEKRICWADISILAGSDCDLISIGSAGMWDTEVVMHEKTKCRIHTFDCTTGDNMPSNIRDRTTFYKVCLGDKDQKHSSGSQFLTWRSMLRLANISRVPSYLKMDIEGFEYGVMRGLAEADDSDLPDQIAMEIHGETGIGLLGAPPTALNWANRAKSPGEILSFLVMLYASGYRMIYIDRGTVCGHCLEVLLAKVYCKNSAQKKR